MVRRLEIKLPDSDVGSLEEENDRFHSKTQPEPEDLVSSIKKVFFEISKHLLLGFFLFIMGISLILIGLSSGFLFWLFIFGWVCTLLGIALLISVFAAILIMLIPGSEETHSKSSIR